MMNPLYPDVRLCSMFRKYGSLNRGLKAFVFLLSSISSVAVLAQPGDVTGVDIRIVEAAPQVLEVQLRPNAPWSFSDGIVNFTFAIRWETSAGGILNSDLIDQVFQGGPPFCMLIGAPMSGTSGVGIDNVDDNGYRYKSFNVSGNQFPSTCVFPAGEWIPYARVPISGVSGCANFEVIRDDDFVLANNTGWFISLGGVDVTSNSQVVGPGVSSGSCGADCNGVVGGTAVPGSACDPGDQCITDAVLNADCECVGVAVAPPAITSLSDTQDICDSETLSLSVVAQGTGSIGYQWSGSGVFLPSSVVAMVDVQDPATGTYSVIVTDACGTAVGDVVVTVSNTPEPSIAAVGTLCSNSASVTLSATPAGGTWSGTGITGNVFDPSAGTQTVNYTLTVGSCTGSTSRTITVDTAPSPIIASVGALCSSSASVTLSATPAGGTWSGTGLTGNIFDPSAGTQTVSYSVTVGACTATTSSTITVTPAPQPSITAVGPLCSNSAAVALTGTPAGGTWSGTGLTGNQFDPSAGTQTVSYSVTVGTCTASTSTTITVTTAPQPSITAVAPLCSNSAAIALTGSPAGGIWSGAGVTGNQFDPSVGTQTVGYTVTVGACTASTSSTITVTPEIQPSITAVGPLCSTSAPVTLVGTPAGGTWSGTGVSGNLFDPSVGTQTVVYSVTVGACTASTTRTITVDAAPQPNISSVGSLCSNSASVALIGTPAGGTWSGTGVAGNQFDPSAGTQTVTYTVTAGACTATTSSSIQVVQAPTADFTLPSTNVYVNQPVEFENNSSAGSYFWDLGDGTTSTVENPTHTYVALGEYTITLIVSAGGCSDTLQVVIMVDINTGIQSPTPSDTRVWAAGEHIHISHSDPNHPQLLVQVLDAGGRIHMEQQMAGNSEKLLLPSESLSAGVWLVLLRSATKVEAHRVVILR